MLPAIKANRRCFHNIEPMPDAAKEPAAPSWLWLDPPTLDFRRSRVGGWTVWLHADPFRALGVSSSASADQLRRARRRLLRRHHPDSISEAHGESATRFREVETAAHAITNDMEVSVEPTAGTWWRFIAFVEPDSLQRSAAAVAGLRFEISDLSRVPLFANGDQRVHVRYGELQLDLPVARSARGLVLPALWARIQTAAEPILLTTLCLLLFALGGLILALDVLVVSDANVLVAWIVGAGAVAAGYGGLVVILVSTGKKAPTPRRAIRRVGAAVLKRRALNTGMRDEGRGP